MLFINNVYAENTKEEVVFSSCVDGDTIKVLVNDSEETVRMLAIDTPETVKPGTEVQPYGKEASDYTCDKVTNAKKIELEYDSGSDKRDKYDRLLAWVYVDDSLLENELISLGYAKVAYIYGEYAYTNSLYDLEKKAAEEKLGIWSEEEYVSTLDTKEENKTFMEALNDLRSEYIEKWINNLLKKVKKYIEDSIKSIFD